jgi:ubiquinone/menaquinone biosynthesis C-methylase UbiE
MDWADRQSEMEDWYRQFSGRDDAAEALAHDYRPYTCFLKSLRGSILDIGGGAGFAARYMDPTTEYLVIDPSPMWAGEEWAALSRKLSTTGTQPRFIMGVGEKLPFDDGRFDAALSFWALNHVADPHRCVGQMHRVLKPGGQALVVLEDMEPSWTDVAQKALRSAARWFGVRAAALDWHQPEVSSVARTLLHKMAGKPWPLQPDHVRIDERDFQRWINGCFTVVRRTWKGGYLSYQLARSPA